MDVPLPRDSVGSMTPDDIFSSITANFDRRKFSAGLAVAFIDFLRDLGLPKPSISKLDDFFEEFPRREWISEGRRANQLIVERPDGETLGIRPFYNRVEDFFRAENSRFDYPSCAPHATQAWRDYETWLDAMCQMTESELVQLRQDICQFVLDTLPDQAFDPGSLVLEPPIFSMILSDFDMTAHRGELSGAAYQGIVFGFLRADNPHLQVEIHKVRVGGKRLQRVGDIDAWEGSRLAITAEVKQYILTAEHTTQFANFANEANKRGAIGIVFSLGFEDGVREAIEDLGVRALDIEDIQAIVGIWDPMKQRTAVASFTYYVKHVEKSSALSERLDAFIKEATSSFGGGD